MCSVSAVTGYGMGIPDNQWTTGTWDSFKGLVKKAEEFDKVAAQPDCIDPAKDEWMKRIEARIEALEAAAFRRA